MAKFQLGIIVLLFCSFTVVRSQKYYSQGNVCFLPKDIGPCDALVPRYYYDQKTELCTLFIWGGCEPNGNNFVTESACVRRCGCSAPAKTGLCRAYIRRYYYNARTNRCSKFVYGGCGANENNFQTHGQCTNACGMNSNRPATTYVYHDTK